MFYRTFGLIGGLFPPFAVTVMLGIANKAINTTRNFFIRSSFFVKNIYNFVIMLLLKNSNLSPSLTSDFILNIEAKSIPLSKIISDFQKTIIVIRK